MVWNAFLGGFGAPNRLCWLKLYPSWPKSDASWPNIGENGAVSEGTGEAKRRFSLGRG